jgi:uncharacterized protein (TIGR03435 family)
MRIIWTLAFALAAAAQPPARFEVVSIRPMPPTEDGRMAMSMDDDPGRVGWKGVPLIVMIAQAYGVNEFQISGPDWLKSERYEVSGKLPEGSTRRQVPEMVRAMLEDRFKLTAHKATREAPVYALSVAKGGSKLKPAQGQDGSMRGGPGRITAIAVPVGMLALQLSRTLDRPVLDETGVSGLFDMKLEYSPENNAGPGGATASSGDTELPSLLPRCRSSLD